ncbi:MAG: pentapeptide repeat-containing protein [Hyphomonadaceae bacterium]
MPKPTQTDKDKLYADWEAEWEAKDFSWEGLKKHSWRAPVDFPGAGDVKGDGEMAYRKSNLQEYWRWSLGVPDVDDQNCLLSDKEMMSAGLLVDVDGALWHILHRKGTHAAAHPALAPAILARLHTASSHYKVNDLLYRGPDGRVQFTGARASNINRLWWQYGSAKNASADGALLHIKADFAEMPHARCRGLHFGYASFGSAGFTGNASFGSATFTGEADFDSATFTSEASFRSATFTGDADFGSATFTGDADFDSATFTGEAYFASATFTGEASFFSATFTGEAYFDSAGFTGNAYFASAGFTGEASFRSATFTGEADFDSATFTGEADFDSAKFEQASSFVDAKWGWSPDAQKWLPVHYGRAFYNARFSENANFETDRFNAFAAFDGADFEKKLYLIDAATRDAHKQRFAEASDAVEAQIIEDAENNEHKETAAMQHWTELSSGYQTVKAVMERNGDVERAQRYHRYEIEARLRRPTARTSEKIAAWLYKSASDYGASITRPLIALLVVWSFAALIYVGLSIGADKASFGPLDLSASFSATLLDAFSLATKSALLNLDSFGGSPVTMLQTSERLFGNGGWAGAARFLGVVQTFLSLILAFLFGLAVRRKFQIR